MRHELYDGRLVIEFDPVKHLYLCNGEKWQSCSQAEKAIDCGKADAFVWWGVNEMRDYLMNNRPRHPEDPGCVVPVEPELYVDLVMKGRLAHKKAKDKAAAIGSKVHDWIDAHIKARQAFGEAPPIPDDPQVRNCIEAFLRDESANSVTYEASELVVASLQHKYVGTLDRACALVQYGGTRAIKDTKTANGMRKGFRIQTAGYAMAYNEMNPDRPIWKRVLDILGKDDASFLAYDCCYPGMTDEESTRLDFECFLRALWILKWDERAEEAMPERKRKKA